jgi:predicted ArsR family transcriptional regulator
MARISDTRGSVHPSWLAVLSDPVRLNLLRGLCEVEATATAAELAPRAHASERTLRRHLDILVELGLAEERRGESDGETQGRPAASYALRASARDQTTALFDLLSQPLGPGGPPRPTPPRDR